ncbi:hypothetical protein ACFL27_26455, partial [candidate division CSSED10-310 bacterium]
PTSNYTEYKSAVSLRQAQDTAAKSVVKSSSLINLRSYVLEINSVSRFLPPAVCIAFSSSFCNSLISQGGSWLQDKIDPAGLLEYNSVEYKTIKLSAKFPHRSHVRDGIN